MNPIQELFHEHDLLKLMVQVLGSMNKRMIEGFTVKTEDIEEAMAFLEEFIEEFHFGKEENLLFPLLRKKGIETDLLDDLSAEHMSVREYIQEIREILKTKGEDERHLAEAFVPRTEGFLAVMALHLDKEEEILYLRAEDVLSGEELEELETESGVFETDMFGAEGHEEYHDTLGRLSRRYL
jgi:hemerythrin-like domain-containing protein